MSDNTSRHENTSSIQGLGPRKRPCLSDPLVHSGRHFGRTIHALCSIQSLLKFGLLRMGERAEDPEESLTAEERQEFRVFTELLMTVPGLEERLMEADQDEIMRISEHLQKGANSARSDDTKSLKGPILDWIIPEGQSLLPPLSRNVKMDRGFHHERTGELLCPAGMDWSDQGIKEGLRSGEIAIPGDQWPLFLYQSYRYDADDAWKGLFRSAVLVSAFKHVFTSPSSVDKEAKATRSGNARIHGMMSVTRGSLAYIATQVRFSLSSCSVFSRSDLVTDSERFYNSLLELLYDPEEQEEVKELLLWWNRQESVQNRMIFPAYSTARRPITTNSALARIKERRARLKAAAAASLQST